MTSITKSILSEIKKARPLKSAKHKGDYGTVLIIGGSEEFIGAPALVAAGAKAVLRSGADKVMVAAPEKVAWAINCLSRDIITVKLKGKYFTTLHTKKIKKLARDADVIVIGNGIGRRSDQFIRTIMKQVKKPKIIDADAIKAIRIQECENSILTPHRKELEMLMKNSKMKTENDLRKNAGTNVILIKGKEDIIISKTKKARNKTGNAIMTKAGTGDVLAGLCAGFFSFTKDAFVSACAAAYVTGKTADMLMKKKGRTMLASDIADNIHLAYK